MGRTSQICQNQNTRMHFFELHPANDREPGRRLCDLKQAAFCCFVLLLVSVRWLYLGPAERARQRLSPGEGGCCDVGACRSLASAARLPGCSPAFL